MCFTASPCCSISVTCWLAILLLVTFTGLQQLSAGTMVAMIGSLWVLCSALILAVIVTGKVVSAITAPITQRGRDIYRDTIGLAVAGGSAIAATRPANDEPISAAYRLAEFHRKRSETPEESDEESAAQAPSPAVGRWWSGVIKVVGIMFMPVIAIWRILAATWSRIRSRQQRIEPKLDPNASGLPANLDNKPKVKKQQLAPAMTGPLAAFTGQQAKATKQPGFASAIAQCRTALTGIAGISIVTNILMLTGPLFMLQIYDRVLTSRSIPTLTALIGLVACLFCFLGVLELIRSRILVRIGLRLDRVLAGNVFRSVLRIAPATTALRTRVLQDLEQLRQFIAGPGPAALFDIPWTPIYFGLIFMFHWVLGVVALGGALVLVAFSLLNELLSRRPVAKASQQSSRALALAEAGWRNAEALHAMGMFERYRDRWHHEHKEGLAIQTRANDLAGTFATLTKISRLFLQSLILATGAYLAIHQQITPGVIIAASIIMSRGLAPVEQSISNWRGFIAARQGAKRIRAALKDLPEEAGRMTLPDAKGYLTVEKLYASSAGQLSAGTERSQFRTQTGRCVGGRWCKRCRQVDTGPRSGRRVAIATWTGAARRGSTVALVAGTAGSADRLPAARHRAARWHGGGEHLPVRSGCRSGIDRIGGVPGASPRSHSATAGRIRDAGG